MKSPAELAARLVGQWSNAALREVRWFDTDAWPLKLTIGKPTPSQVRDAPAEVRKHLADWRAVNTGEVAWRAVRYQSLAEPLEIPDRWIVRNIGEWVDASADRSVQAEFRVLSKLLDRADPRFHRALIRGKSPVLNLAPDEVLRACAVAAAIEPGMARGEPLRTLSIAGSDTKFLERNRRLVSQLLDCRYDGVVSEVGLENFLDCAAAGRHWVMVCPLAPGLLPFAEQRVRTSELAQTPLPGSHLLVVENETCRYLLPPLESTVAVLGAGLDLDWLHADWIGGRHVGYWGDIDTWGLRILALARAARPDLDALMMDVDTFEQFEPAAVVEPQPATLFEGAALTDTEMCLFERLQGTERNRLEQEFVDRNYAAEQIRRWFALGDGS